MSHYMDDAPMPKEVTLARELKALGQLVGVKSLSAREIRNLHIAENIDGMMASKSKAEDLALWGRNNPGMLNLLEWALREREKWLEEYYP